MEQKAAKREAAAKRKKAIDKARGDEVIILDRKEITRKLEVVTRQYIKLRDWGKPCISCGEVHLPDFDAGHFHKRSVEPALKFHSMNIHAQCRDCNSKDDGNAAAMLEGIKARYGYEVAAKVKEMNLNPLRLTGWQLNEVLKYRTKEVKRMRKEING